MKVKKLKDTHVFSIIEEELLVSKKNNKKFTRALLHFFSSHIFFCFSMSFLLRL